MSSMYSGRIHLRMADQPNASQSEQDRYHTDEAKLAIGQFNQLAKAVAPDARREQRQHAFDHQHQRERSEQRVRHRVSPGSAIYLAGVLPPPVAAPAPPPGVFR